MVGPSVGTEKTSAVNRAARRDRRVDIEIGPPAHNILNTDCSLWLASFEWSLSAADLLESAMSRFVRGIRSNSDSGSIMSPPSPLTTSESGVFGTHTGGAGSFMTEIPHRPACASSCESRVCRYAEPQSSQ